MSSPSENPVTFVQIITSLVGFFALFIPTIKLLIADYLKRKLKIETLLEEKRNKEISNLTDQVKDLKISINDIKLEIINFHQNSDATIEKIFKINDDLKTLTADIAS